MTEFAINRITCGRGRGQLDQGSGGRRISLRRFPYPYKAAMAICSDIDGTKTTGEFLEIQRFLNTKDVTSMGEGIGLEIGNSFYFYDAANVFSFFCRDERAREVIIGLIRAGYIDCLHSYGGRAIRRNQVERAIEVLEAAGCRLEVWTNHSDARSNIGRKLGRGGGSCDGDNPEAGVYHADLTLSFGIQYAWVGSHTRIVGQDADGPVSPLSTLWDSDHPVASILGVLKETRKTSLGIVGDPRYSLHRENRLMGGLRLADGQRLHEFMRYGNHPAGVAEGATSRGLAYVISARALRHLKGRRGYMIVYAHLGKNAGCGEVIARETQLALRGLEREFRDGEIYVTTTAKMLNYYRAHRYLEWSEREAEGHVQIRIHHLRDPILGLTVPSIEQLQGITFYVGRGIDAELFIGDTRVEGVIRNPADDSGIESVTIPFTVLRFPY